MQTILYTFFEYLSLHCICFAHSVQEEQYFLPQPIDIERCKNRLLKFCYVPATSAAHIRLLFLLQPFAVLMKQTRQAVCAVKQSIFLDVYASTLFFIIFQGGGAITFLISFFLQFPFTLYCQRKDVSNFTKLLVNFFVTVVGVVATVNTFRGYWYLMDEYLFPGKTF